jgi:hypothetical protein
VLALVAAALAAILVESRPAGPAEEQRLAELTPVEEAA